MDIQYAQTKRLEALQSHPNLKDDINDLFELMLSEIEEGGSETHEVELFLNDLESLLNSF